MAKKNGFKVWDDEFDQEFYSAQEIEAGNIRIALIGEIIKSRKGTKDQPARLRAYERIKTTRYCKAGEEEIQAQPWIR